MQLFSISSAGTPWSRMLRLKYILSQRAIDDKIHVFASFICKYHAKKKTPSVSYIIHFSIRLSLISDRRAGEIV